MTDIQRPPDENSGITNPVGSMKKALGTGAVLFGLGILSWYIYDAYRQQASEARERSAIMFAIERADSITSYIPAAKKSHQHVFDDPQSLAGLRALIRLEGGKRNGECYGLTDGGMSIELSIGTPDQLRIRFNSSAIYTYRTHDDGKQQCFVWNSDYRRLYNLATQCGFAWPLLSDIFGQ